MLEYLVRVDDVKMFVGKVQAIDVAHLKREIGCLVGLFGVRQFDDRVRYVNADNGPVVHLSRQARRDVARSAPDIQHRHGAAQMR